MSSIPEGCQKNLLGADWAWEHPVTDLEARNTEIQQGKHQKKLNAENIKLL